VCSKCRCEFPDAEKKCISCGTLRECVSAIAIPSSETNEAKDVSVGKEMLLLPTPLPEVVALAEDIDTQPTSLQPSGSDDNVIIRPTYRTDSANHIKDDLTVKQLHADLFSHGLSTRGSVSALSMRLFYALNPPTSLVQINLCTDLLILQAMLMAAKQPASIGSLLNLRSRVLTAYHLTEPPSEKVLEISNPIISELSVSPSSIELLDYSSTISPQPSPTVVLSTPMTPSDELLDYSPTTSPVLLPSPTPVLSTPMRLSASTSPEFPRLSDSDVYANIDRMLNTLGSAIPDEKKTLKHLKGCYKCQIADPGDNSLCTIVPRNLDAMKMLDSHLAKLHQTTKLTLDDSSSWAHALFAQKATSTRDVHDTAIKIKNKLAKFLVKTRNDAGFEGLFDLMRDPAISNGWNQDEQSSAAYSVLNMLELLLTATTEMPTVDLKFLLLPLSRMTGKIYRVHIYNEGFLPNSPHPTTPPWISTNYYPSPASVAMTTSLKGFTQMEFITVGYIQTHRPSKRQFVITTALQSSSPDVCSANKDLLCL
jgi:hypothetical protein